MTIMNIMMYSIVQWRMNPVPLFFKYPEGLDASLFADRVLGTFVTTAAVNAASGVFVDEDT